MRKTGGLKDRTTIEIWDATSQLVKVLVDENLEVGRYEITVSSTNLNSGVYFVRMKSGPFSDIKRLVIAK